MPLFAMAANKNMTEYKVVKKIDGFKKGDIVTEQAFASSELKDYLAEERLEEVVSSEDNVPDGVSSVYDADGKFVRNFSSEIHGKNYAKLAKQFCDTNNCVVKV